MSRAASVENSDGVAEYFVLGRGEGVSVSVRYPVSRRAASSTCR